MIPAKFAGYAKLDTTTMDNFFPNLVDHFGAHRPVKVELDLLRIGSFESKKVDQHLSVQLDVRIRFLVENANKTISEAINVKLMDLMADVSVLATADMKPVVKVLGASVGYISETRSAVGHINCTTLANNINTALGGGIEVFNGWFASKADSFVIPTSIMGLFDLSDLTIKYHDGYIEAGLTPTFIPQ
jgi:hypothetical protein